MSLEIIVRERLITSNLTSTVFLSRYPCRRRVTMDNVELRVVLLEEHGLGRITVGLEEYFNFSFSLSDELEKLEREFGDLPTCRWNRRAPDYEG